MKGFSEREDISARPSTMGRRIPVDICDKSDSVLDHNHFVDKNLEPLGCEYRKAKMKLKRLNSHLFFKNVY